MVQPTCQVAAEGTEPPLPPRFADPVAFCGLRMGKTIIVVMGGLLWKIGFIVFPWFGEKVAFHTHLDNCSFGFVWQRSTPPIHNRMCHNCGGPKAPVLRQTPKSHGWVTFLKVSYRTPIKWLGPRQISADQQQNQRTQHQGQHNQVCPKKSWSYHIYIYIYTFYI